MSTTSRNTFVLFALLCAAIGAGCAGGSGAAPSIPTPPPPPPVTFPPPPPPQPTNNSWQPSPGPGEANTYVYSSVITTTFVRPPVVQSPIPSPNPTVSALFVSSGTNNINTSVTSGNTFPVTGQTGLVDFTTAEVDTGIVGQFSTVTTLSNTYYNYTPGAKGTTVVTAVGATALREAGQPDQTSYTTVYGAHNGLLDVVPEPSVTGQHVPVGPPNDATMTTTEKDADGQVTTRKVFPDGSYQENVTYPDGTSAQATETSAGTAFYSFPLQGDPGGQNSTVQVGAPASGQIPIVVTYAKGVFGLKQPKTVPTSVPVWYPSQPVKLYQQTYTNDGPTALPNPFPSPVPGVVAGVCALGKLPNGHIQQKPPSNLLVQTTTNVDVLFGEIATTTSRVWNTEGIGLTCADTTSVTNQFYDYSGQSFFVPSFQSTPLQITTFDYQIGITTATIFNKSYHFGKGGTQTRDIQQRTTNGQMRTQVRSGSRSRGAPPRGPSEILLARAMTHEMFIRIERARLERHAMLWRKLKALHFKGIH